MVRRNSEFRIPNSELARSPILPFSFSLSLPHVGHGNGDGHGLLSAGEADLLDLRVELDAVRQVEPLHPDDPLPYNHRKKETKVTINDLSIRSLVHYAGSKGDASCPKSHRSGGSSRARSGPPTPWRSSSAWAGTASTPSPRLYLTNAVADGGLGFSSEDRGVIQGLATFFLYLFPAVFGALADRYGYKRMFLASVRGHGAGLHPARRTPHLLGLSRRLLPGRRRPRHVQAGGDLHRRQDHQRRRPARWASASST